MTNIFQDNLLVCIELLVYLQQLLTIGRYRQGAIADNYTVLECIRLCQPDLQK